MSVIFLGSERFLTRQEQMGDKLRGKSKHTEVAGGETGDCERFHRPLIATDQKLTSEDVAS